MARPERIIDPEEGPIQRFSYDLRQLRKDAGNPTYRDMAARVHYSVAALSEAARGTRKPTLEITRAYVRACGGNRADWDRRWHDLNASLGLEAQEEEVLLPAEVGLPGGIVIDSVDRLPTRTRGPSLTELEPTTPSVGSSDTVPARFAYMLTIGSFVIGVLISLLITFTTLSALQIT